jgi:hypothetical protein
VVNYGFDLQRHKASKRALERLDRADPVVGKKIFIELAEEQYFSYLKDRGWEYHYYKSSEETENLFQKEPLWNIGTKLAFKDEKISKVVLLDADCVFHDNSWAYVINTSLATHEFVQPFAAILYSEQKDYTDSIPSIAYCMATKQQHWLAVPGGAFACTRGFFFNILNGAWPINPVGSGDDQMWKYLYGHTPIVSNNFMKSLAPVGRYNSFVVGYSPLLLNHYYHGPMRNRMYGTRSYIAGRCLTGEETTLNKDGLLEWSDNSMGKIMQKSMSTLKDHTEAYLQVGRAFTQLDTKDMFKHICKEELGGIDKDHPLMIVTTFKKYGVNTVPQINLLREAVHRTFKCPHTFNVVTDAKYVFSDPIYCDIPSNLILPGYEWIMAASLDVPSNTSILYLDPSVKLTGTCDMIRCSDDGIYLAHPIRAWSTKIMYFKHMGYVTHAYLDDVRDPEHRPDRLYPDSANYLITKLLEGTAYHIRDVLFYLDYEVAGKEQLKTTNVLL